MKIRIATRKSALALWQAEHVRARIAAIDGVEAVELVPLSTRGDEILDRSLQKIGGKGLFIKELETAIRDGAADIAVHSMKDVPADLPDGFRIAAVLERANHADALVCRGAQSLDDLRDGARVGSSSLRRQAQLRMLRADLRIEALRGNVNTRLAKLDAGDFDAIVLAAAGLERLGMQDRIGQQFDSIDMLPAAAQGVIGIECLEERSSLIDVLGELAHEPTRRTTAAERMVARILQASCQSPVAAHAVIDGATLDLRALVALPDGSEHLRDEISGAPADAENLGRALAERLLSRGAASLLARAEAMTGNADA